MTTIALVLALTCAVFLLAVAVAIAITNRKEIENLREWKATVYLPEVRLGLEARRELASSALEKAEDAGDDEGRSVATLALHDIDVMEKILRHH